MQENFYCLLTHKIDVIRNFAKCIIDQKLEQLITISDIVILDDSSADCFLYYGLKRYVLEFYRSGKCVLVPYRLSGTAKGLPFFLDYENTKDLTNYLKHLTQQLSIT